MHFIRSCAGKLHNFPQNFSFYSIKDLFYRPGKGVGSHTHTLVHASQHWEVRLIVHLFIKNQLLFTIVPGISNHGLEQLTNITHFDEQNME